MMNRQNKRILNIREVSEFLRIPLSTIYVLVKQGKIKGAKFGRQWRFLEQDILDYIHGDGDQRHAA